jgi:hypothetical protein
VRDYHESIGLSQKAIAVDQITAQARQEESEAAYLRGAAKSALFSGDLAAGADVLKAVGQGLSTPSGDPGSPNIGAMLATVAGF